MELVQFRDTDNNSFWMYHLGNEEDRDWDSLGPWSKNFLKVRCPGESAEIYINPVWILEYARDSITSDSI